MNRCLAKKVTIQKKQNILVYANNSTFLSTTHVAARQIISRELTINVGKRSSKNITEESFFHPYQMAELAPAVAVGFEVQANVRGINRWLFLEEGQKKRVIWKTSWKAAVLYF